MRPVFARKLLNQEREEIEALLHHPVECWAKRAAIVLLSSEERYRAPEISVLVGMHASNVRYWIHRFNEEGMLVLRPNEAPHWGSSLDPEVRQTLIQLATTPPRELGLKFTTWTLRQLRKYLMEHDVVNDISHETIRRILHSENIDWRACGTLPQDPSIPDILGTYQEGRKEEA
jgi:transposase